MLFISILVSLYNLIWTTLQSILAIMTVHKGFFKNYDLCNAKSYQSNQKLYNFEYKKFWGWIISALFHGGFITFTILQNYQAVSLNLDNLLSTADANLTQSLDGELANLNSTDSVGLNLELAGLDSSNTTNSTDSVFNLENFEDFIQDSLFSRPVG